MAIRTVIDTTMLVAALPPKSVYHWLIERLLEEEYELYLTEEIVLEYAAKLTSTYSPAVAKNFLVALKHLPNVHFCENSMPAPNENKFVNCYTATGANYLITRQRIRDFEEALKDDGWEEI